MTYDHVFQDGSRVFAADLNTLASEVNGKLSQTDADANYAPVPSTSPALNPLTGFVQVPPAATAAQINSAITYAAAQTVARGVMLAAGEYTLETSLLIGALSGKALVGSGVLATKLKVAGATTAAILASSTAGLTQCELRDFTLDGQWSSGAGINGIQVTNAPGMRIRNVGVTNFGAAGILLQGLNSGGGCPLSTVKDCEVSNTGLADGTTGHGIWIKDASPYAVVASNRVTGVKGGMGIGMSGAAGTGYPAYGQIEGNVVLNMQASATGFEGIGVTAGCVNTVVSGNTVKTTYDNGISVSADRCTVVGNNVEDTYNHGITAGGKGTTVTGNYVRNVGKENSALGFGGICLDTGASWCVVVGNRITDDQTTHTMGYGVKINSSGGNNRVGPNSIDGWLTAAYYGFLSTDFSIDAETYSTGYAFPRVFTDYLASKTASGSISIASTVYATNQMVVGSGAAKTAQQTVLSNVPATRSNLALVAQAGQAANVLDVYDSSGAVIAGITRGGMFAAPMPGGYQNSDGKTRRAVQNVACGISSQTGAYAGNSWTLRNAFSIPVPTTRYRFRIANRWGAGNGSTAITLTGLWIGQAATATDGTPNGNFTATPTSVQGAITMPTDGSDYVTAWTTGVLDPTLLYLLSFGITLPSGGYCQNQTETWFVSGAGNGGAQNLTSATYFAAGALDVRIEYETEGAYPSGLWLGASISGCYTTEGQKIRQSFPQQHGRHRRHLVTHSPVVSGTLADYESTPASNWRWQRLLSATPNLDYAVVCEMATNSISSGAGIAAMQASFGNIVSYLRDTLGIKRIYALTLTPVGNVSGTLAAAAAAGATSISSTVSPGGGYIGVGAGALCETVQQTAVSGSGPYTVTVTALAEAHAAGERVLSQAEVLREFYNRWVRELPFGISGVIEGDFAVRSATSPAIADPSVVEVDNLHLRAGGQALIESRIPGPLI